MPPQVFLFSRCDSQGLSYLPPSALWLMWAVFQMHAQTRLTLKNILPAATTGLWHGGVVYLLLPAASDEVILDERKLQK